ncbi:MAG TPA: hypothetical protein VGO61_16935 [Steroidobacteraceae bacterium]|jgi:hypothetical protein|nr:hypothetical protein [Steroidobacteraceae bacterium]
MTADAQRQAERQELFARLPVGRSASVRALLIVGALITAGCLLWIHQLRLSGNPGGLAAIFFVLFAFFDYGAAKLALAILLLALFVPRWDGFDRLLRRLGEHPILIGSAVTVLLSLGTLFIYRNQPLSMDEFAPFFQSQVFASRHVSGQYPVDLLNYLIPGEFQNWFLNISRDTGDVSSSYWPSFALLLTPFTLLGIPWACNAVLSGLTIIVLNRLALRLFESVEAAGMVMLFTLASPVFFADGISYYSMTSHMLANSLFALLVLKPTAGRLVAAGVVGSIALTLHNPVPHFLFALPWFVWLARKEKPVARLAALCAGYLPLSIVLGIGWFVYSGQLVHDGGAVTGGVGSLGGVVLAFAWPDLTLLYARLVGLAKLLLWAAPCVLLLTFAGGWRARADRRIATLSASALLTFAGYLFVWADQGHGWGFRYFHSAWLVLPLLATAFLYTPSENPRSANAPAVESPAITDARTYIVACALMSLLVGVALRASQMGEFMDRHLAQLPHYAGTEPRVVVISGVGFYPYDLVQNDPFLRKDEVRMVQVGKNQTAAAIRRHFPTYQVVYRDQRGEVWSDASPLPGGTAH